ncbi:secreted protein [Vibrio sp. JCM 19236]|nr:secreted protein [Vibrio sp. JCM 19236]
MTTNEEALQITDKNYQMFQDLGVQGTPAILIDGQIIPGYVPYEKLSPMVEELLAEAK